jgi:hypothetical protein
MDKCGWAGQVTDDGTTECIYFARWINKSADTYSEYVTLIAFSGQQK